MKHSQTTISQILNDVNILNEEINNTVLIGEKCGLIYDASHTYNKLKTLITPDYLSDEEFIWFKEIGALCSHFMKISNHIRIPLVIPG